MSAQGTTAPDLAIKTHTRRSWVLIGAAALLIDGFLLSAHAMHNAETLFGRGPVSLSAFQAPFWNGGRDRSSVELFGLFQLAVGALLLFKVATRSKRYFVLYAWGGVLLAIAADDLLQLHERAGQFLGPYQAELAVDRDVAQEVGGLAFWCLSGLVLGGALISTHRTSCPSARHASVRLATSLLPLTLVVVGYVLSSVYSPELINGVNSSLIVLVRVAAKLLTMTLILVQAVRLTDTESCPPPGKIPPMVAHDRTNPS